MTSFINSATLPLKWAHKEQRSVSRLLWPKGLSTNAIQSEMRPVYGDKYFTRPAIHVWCKKFAHGWDSVVDEEEPGRRVVSTTDATIAAVDSLVRSNRRVRRDKCLHEFGRYVEKRNINVRRLNTFACWTCSLFCCSRLASCKRKLLAKYYADWLRSKYKWRHNNDVIVIKIPVYVPN